MQEGVLTSANRMLAASIGFNARALYGSGGLSCAEALLTVINHEFDGGLSRDCVMALSTGFCGGIGDAGDVCGALTGAVMAQGLILGRGESPIRGDDARKAARELLDRFVARHGSTCCKVLCAARDPESDLKGPCLEYVETAATLCAELILAANAVDPADPAAAHAALMKRRRRERKAAKTAA